MIYSLSRLSVASLRRFYILSISVQFVSSKRLWRMLCELCCSEILFQCDLYSIVFVQSKMICSLAIWHWQLHFFSFEFLLNSHLILSFITFNDRYSISLLLSSSICNPHFLRFARLMVSSKFHIHSTLNTFSFIDVCAYVEEIFQYSI